MKDLLPTAIDVSVQLQSVDGASVLRARVDGSNDLYLLDPKGKMKHLYGPVLDVGPWIHVDRTAGCVGLTRGGGGGGDGRCELRSVTAGEALVTTGCSSLGSVVSIDCASRTMLVDDVAGQTVVSAVGAHSVDLPAPWGLLTRAVGDCVAVGRPEALTVQCAGVRRAIAWPFAVNTTSDLAMSEPDGDRVWVALVDRQQPRLWLAVVDTSEVAEVRWYHAALEGPSSVYLPVYHDGRICMALEPVVPPHSAEPPRQMACVTLPR